MNEIKIGTPVYHVEEYRLSNYELKQKGFEGFDNYGLEVVEHRKQREQYTSLGEISAWKGSISEQRRSCRRS